MVNGLIDNMVQGHIKVASHPTKTWAAVVSTEMLMQILALTKILTLAN